MFTLKSTIFPTRAKKTIFCTALIFSLLAHLHYMALGSKYLSTCGSVGGSLGMLFLPLEALIESLPIFFYVWGLGFVFYNFIIRRIIDPTIILVSIFLVVFSWFGGSLLLNLAKTNSLTQKISAMTSPIEIRETLHSSPKLYQKYILVTIALNSFTDSRTLDEISQLTDLNLHDSLGCSIYNNLVPNLDRGMGVMRRIAQHKNASTETLARLANSPNFFVIRDVAGNPNTSTEVLNQLWKKYDRNIICEIAKNPNIPSKILAEIIKNDDYLNDNSLSLSLAQNPNTPIKVLVKLSDTTGSYDYLILNSLLDNSSLPNEIVERLADHSILSISEKAKNKLNAKRV